MFTAIGIHTILTAPQALRMNAIAERWISSLRRECIDRLLVAGQSQFQHVLGVYVEHYKANRRHQGHDMNLRAPNDDPKLNPRPTPTGWITRTQRLAGLLNALMFGMLHCTASYAAAQAGDRDRSRELLADAATAATRLAEGSLRQRTLLGNIISYRICGAHALGDPAAGLAHAHTHPLALIPATERRARVLVDTARCWFDHGSPERAYRALLVAERTAPGETRTRTAVRDLVTDLRHTPHQDAMPQLAQLARRVHAVALPPAYTPVHRHWSWRSAPRMLARHWYIRPPPKRQSSDPVHRPAHDVRPGQWVQRPAYVYPACLEYFTLRNRGRRGGL
ncbi:integrase core domain-containing protein [Actinokineospora diospyrosa]|uniref:Integrase core domain n=1 Tax=Actinokineospora diospyrosa TaxID=103728 RepID=A0ABT1IJ22_9PSEU|nr:integrase core domain-containing protein [Actinokineospora diospyrosa]MCP2272655.1 Integrase core domain [Actinokineospora diospyrosa]